MKPGIHERRIPMKSLARQFTAATICGFTFLAPAAFAVDEVMTEDAAIAVLQSSTDWTARYEACQSLRHNASEKAVPALAGLLGDPTLAHAARLALEPLPSPAADAALREALNSVEGELKAGVAITLGARRDDKATADLAALLKSDDRVVADAAAGALGRIASPKAIAALEKGKGGASADAAGEGLLAAGDVLRADGEGKKAAKVYQDLLDGEWPAHIKAGAFTGLTLSEPDKTSERVLAALADESSPYIGLAGQLVADTDDDTAAYAEALADLPEAGKVALLRGLGRRGDAAARDAVAAEVAEGSPAVKLAAIPALGSVGGADDVPALAAYLDDADQAIAAAARESLRTMEAEGAEGALSNLTMTAGLAEKPAVIGVLADRRSSLAIPAAVANLKDASADVRIASLQAISSFGKPSEMPYLIAALASAVEPAEQSAVADALTTIGGVYGEEVLEPVLGALDTANPDGQITLMRTLSRIGGDKALAAVEGKLDDPTDSVSGEALRVVSNWPGQEAAPLLLDLASMRDPSKHAMGLRGYVRLARDQGDGAKKAEMLQAVMPFTLQPEEKWLIFAAWGTLPSQQSVDVLTPYLEDPAVRNEAAAALISIAAEIAKHGDEGKAAAKAALEKVVAAIEDASIKDRAAKALAALG